MKMRIRKRLVGLVLVFGLMGVFIGILAWVAQTKLESLRTNLKKSDLESASILDPLETSLVALNSDMIKFGLTHDQALWERAWHQAVKLQGWIGQQKSALHTASEAALLKRIQTADETFLRSLQDFYVKVKFQHNRGTSLADYTPLRDQSLQLFDLGHDLARAHSEAHNVYIKDANQSLEDLQRLVLLTDLLLFAAGLALALGIYRHLISPLEQKLVESQFQTERHERLASIGLLASGTAVDLRNLLTTVKIGVHFQATRWPEHSPERAEAEVVENEVRKLDRLVDDFLTLTQMVTPQVEVVALDELLKELRQRFVPKLATMDIHVVADAPEPLLVRAEPIQLKQALVNLIQIAADQIKANGCITLKARRDPGNPDSHEPPKAILEVIHSIKEIKTGDESSRANAETAVSRNLQTEGLSLAITAKILDRHGGRLLYPDQTGLESKFSIILPLAHH